MERHNYLAFLTTHTEDTKACLFNESIQYLYVPNTGGFRDGGVSITVGLNLARFFTRKIILGICFDFKEMAYLPTQTFSKGFVNDFNSAYIPAQRNNRDSAVAQTLKDDINSTAGSKIRGTIVNSIGVSFSPFPQSFGAIQLQIRKGQQSFTCYSNYGTRIITEYSSNNNILDLILNNNYYAVLSCKPYRFFHSENIYDVPEKWTEFYKFISVSLYYERLSFAGATLEGLPLSSILGQSFLSKYSVVNNFGVRVGFSLN